MKVLDLFSGIGGFSLGLERAGFETAAFCEIEEYPRKVLAKHWPNIPIYSDVRELTYERLESDGITRIDVITGGFPCQDISLAGKQAGITDETRSGLWSECARLLGEIRPRYAIFENVTALLSGNRGKWFQRVLFDISQVGYNAEWHCIPASSVGARHYRDRVWILAYPSCKRRQQITKSTYGDESQNEGGTKVQTYKPKCNGKRGRKWTLADTNNGKREQYGIIAGMGWESFTEKNKIHGHTTGAPWEVEPEVGRVANGIPRRVDRLKGLGNAVVPQIPELIGRAIMEAEKTQ